MKKFLFVVFALSLLLVSGSSIAEPTDPNEVGLYLTPDGYGPTGTFEVGTPVTVYLVLTKPTDTDTGIPYNTFNAFECRLNFSPAGSLFKLGEVFPGDYINIGDSANIQLGYMEYVVGFANDIPVVDEAGVLITFTFMHVGTGVIEVTLTPTLDVQSIPGEMAMQSESGHLEIMYSMGGSFDAPVFLFNGLAVAVEDESFGSVKALYR